MDSYIFDGNKDYMFTIKNKQTWEKFEFVHKPDFVNLKCPHLSLCMIYDLQECGSCKRPKNIQKFRIRFSCHFPVTFYLSFNFCLKICGFYYFDTKVHTLKKICPQTRLAGLCLFSCLAHSKRHFVKINPFSDYQEKSLKPKCHNDRIQKRKV